MAQYGVLVLKVPLNPKQPTNQVTSADFWVKLLDVAFCSNFVLLIFCWCAMHFVSWVSWDVVCRK